MRITTDELMEAVQQALTKPTAPDSVFTVGDLVTATGVHEKRIRQALRGIAGSGKLEVHRVFRTDISGRPVMVPAYRITT